MANRVVEWVASLKDKVSGKIDTITRKLRGNAQAAQESAAKIQASNTLAAKSFGLLEGGVARIAGLLGGAYLGRAAVRSLREFADEADRIGKLSATLNSSTEALSKLGFVAENNGVSISSLTAGVRKLNRRLGLAEEGGGAAARALDQLGIEARELIGLDLDEKIRIIGRAYRELEGEQQRAAIATELFGVSQDGLTRILNLTEEQFNATLAEAEKYGAVISGDMAGAAADFNDQLQRLSTRWGALERRFAYGSALIVNKVTAAFDPLPAERLRLQLESVSREIEILARAADQGLELKNIDQSAERVAELREEFLRLTAAIEGAQEVQRQETDDQGLTDEAEKEARSRIALFKAELAERKALVREYTRTIDQLERRQQEAADTFDELRRKADRGARDGEPADFLETSLAVKTAEGLISRGEGEAALAQVERAKALVESLAEQGDRAAGFFASELKRLSEAALSTQIDTAKRARELAQTYAEDTRLAINAELAKVEEPELPKISVAEAAKKAAAELKSSIESELARSPIQAPVQIMREDPRIRNASELAAQRWEAELEKRGNK